MSLHDARLADAFRAGEAAIALRGPHFDATAETVQRKLLQAFQAAGITEADLGSGTGYGYGDRGREAVERVFALALDAPRALVRTQLVSGTHALSTVLLGLLRSGDLLLSATGLPYDTLLPVIGPGPGSLDENGVRYASVDPWIDGQFVPEAAVDAVKGLGPRMVLIQRSRGYSARPAVGPEQLRDLIGRLRRAGGSEMIVLIDNCYSEFVAPEEPTAYGADLLCGSLIKNPGGGIAPTGGYIAGAETLVETAATRLFAPGLGSAVGPLMVPARLLLQGLFLAPGAVSSALKTAVYAAAVFAAMGHTVDPRPADERGDIIQSITLGSRELLAEFCRAIQAASPIDAAARPEFAPMPGYDHEVIMAAGAFIQGATLELSADAPDIEPYRVYMQGGLGTGYGKAAVEAAARAVTARWA